MYFNLYMLGFHERERDGPYHTIPLEEGHKSPFIPIYRFCPLEIEEAKRQIT